MKTMAYPEILRKFSKPKSTKMQKLLIYLLCIVCWLVPSIAKADTPIPTSVVASYNAALNKLTLTISWSWPSTANSKVIGAAIFADLNGDGISPTFLDNPATYTSGGNPFPAGLTARDEFLGQLAISNIEGSATSALFPALIDNTDNGIASTVSGFTSSTARVLFPYGINPVETVGTSGTFTMTFTNVTVTPVKICVVMYDVHTPLSSNTSGNHSPRSANPDYNGDNSVESGNSNGTVSCTGLVSLTCAVNKTEGPCQTQTAINTSYASWLATVTASGCNGVLTNNSTGAPSASGGSSTVTFTYSQTGCSSQVSTTTCTATFTVTPCIKTNPDFNVTFVNVPVPGNVSTNDIVPAGTTYGTSPTLTSSPSGSSPSITMNSNGTYSFVSNLPGVYKYNVPVCVPGQSAPCPPTELTITVLDALINTNPPIAKVDIASTMVNTPVTLKTLANDKPGSFTTLLVPSTVTVTLVPLHGTTSVNPANGDITYSPAAGYTGYDTLTYNVCDNQSPAKCASAKQIITISASGSPNTTAAADDFNTTPMNIPVSGNVKTNDTDPEGNNQTVTTQNTTVTGKGTLVLAANGTYTFTPVIGFTGPIDFPYTTCDDGVPQACASATLHLLVRPPVALTNPDFNSTFVNIYVHGNVNTNDFVPAGTTYGTSPALLSSPAGSSPILTMNSNGTYNFVSNLPGVFTYDVPVCAPSQPVPCPPTKLVITVLNSQITSNPPVANVDIATTNLNIPVTLKTLANDAAGNLSTSLDPSSVIVTVAPPHGTTSINPANGDITYTPNTGFTGSDTLTYQVCDNQFPVKCATAKQIITVKPAGVGNTTVAADDYQITNINTVAYGNVKTNDSDPEGDIQTVIPQNTTVPGRGSIVLLANGSYTYTPFLNYSGPVDFPYTTCDNGSPQACASATLHILVRPDLSVPDFTPFNDINSLSFTAQTLVRDLVINIEEVLNTPSLGQVVFRVRKLSAFTITYNPTATMADVYGGSPVNNSDWIFSEDANFVTCTLKPGKTISGFGLSSLGFTITRNPNVAVNTSQNITVTIITNSGGDSNSTNNQAVTTITAN